MVTKQEDSGTLSTHQVDRLYGPVDEVRTQKVEDLCDVFGIDPIDMAGWNLIESLALITELEKLALGLQ